MLSKIRDDFACRYAIPSYGLLEDLFRIICPNKRSRSLERVLDRCETMFEKELDVINLIKA